MSSNHVLALVAVLLVGCRAPLAAEPPRAQRSVRPATTSTAPGRDAPAGDSAPRSTGPRFFLHGDGLIDLRNFHTGEEKRVRFRNADGSYSNQALAELRTLFRSRGDDRTADVSLRLIELLDYLQDRFKPGEMLLMSGYRSPEYNAAIREKGAQAAKSSLHTEGLAADVRFVGLDQHALWLDIRELDCCGAGYYRTGQFLHLDVGRPRFWEETTSRVGENLSAGNARVFARTDFDRYPSLPGAIVSLHAVSLRPLRIARRAELVGEPGSGDGPAEALDLVPAAEPALESEHDCFVLSDAPATPPDRFLVAGSPSAPSDSPARGSSGQRTLRGRIVLHTCEPRLEATPARIESNPIELGR